ncbi:MAG: stage III sporulation protein AD [Hyphomonadaceae bacterium]|nr:stage III sporulation protein AD [Clostridia bacterium]
MDIIQTIGIGLVAVVISMLLKQVRPELALMVVMAAGVIIFLGIARQLQEVISMFERIADRANLDFIYLPLLLKVIGIAYLGEFASMLCKDANENTVAMKISLAAKVLILVTATPVILSLLNMMLGLLN